MTGRKYETIYNNNYLVGGILEVIKSSLGGDRSPLVDIVRKSYPIVGKI